VEKGQKIWEGKGGIPAIKKAALCLGGHMAQEETGEAQEKKKGGQRKKQRGGAPDVLYTRLPRH